MSDTEQVNQLKSEVSQLASINQDLLDALTLVVKRLESLPDAEPMDDLRHEIERIDRRVQRVLSAHHGPQEPRGINLPHPDNFR